jgi:hypothetical protein
MRTGVFEANFMAKDKFHELVRDALERDGWTITDDPFVLRLADKKMVADLGAERLIAAELMLLGHWP